MIGGRLEARGDVLERRVKRKTLGGEPIKILTSEGGGGGGLRDRNNRCEDQM